MKSLMEAASRCQPTVAASTGYGGKAPICPKYDRDNEIYACLRMLAISSYDH